MLIGEIIKRMANGLKNLANNGVGYTNWEIAGVGTTKSGSGIHLVQSTSTDYASLQINGLKSNTVYTLVYKVTATDLNSDIAFPAYAIVGSFSTVAIILSKTIGVNKVLVTTASDVSVNNKIVFVCTAGNTDGKYIDFTDIMLLEGNQTTNSETDVYIPY